jgi:Cu/Ag efflux pump CusA
VLYLRGATFTTMTLLGLAAALAVCIDDVITDIDAARRLSTAAGGTGEPAPVTMTEAFSAVRGPLIFATLAIAVATVPFIAMGSLVTAFTRPMVLSYALAVLASTLVAFTLTPTLAALLLRGRAGRQGWFARWVKRGTGRLLASSAARPGRVWSLAAVFAIVGAVMAVAVAVPNAREHSVLPILQDRNLLLRLETMPGTSLPEMNRVSSAVVRAMRSMPAVADVGAHAGRAVGSDQLTGVNTAEVWVTLKGGVGYARSLSAIKAMMRDFSGVKATLLSYPADRLAQAAAGRKNDLVVRVYGADLATLQAKAAGIRAMLAHVPGVADPAVRPIPQQPTVDIEVNLAAAQRHGLRPGDVRRDVTTLTSGLIVGNLYEQSKIYDVVVWGAPQVRGNLTELRNLLIDTPSGGQVALKDVATVRIRPEPVAITHDDVLRTVEVAARITGDPSAVTAAVRSRVAHMPMPYEYHAEVFGNAVTKQADLTRTLGFGAVALVIVLLLFQAAVGSWRRAGLLLVSLPLSLAGGVLTAPLAGGLWNAGSLVAMFGVLALAIRASVLTGRRMAAAERAQAASMRPMMFDAACERAVPLVQSVFAIAVIVLPTAVLSAGAGLENLHPLAVTMLGGLASLLVAQAFVLPALLLAPAGGWSGGLRPRPATASPGAGTAAAPNRERRDIPMFTRIATGLGAAALAFLAACGHQDPGLRSPATLTKIAGSTVQQVQLTTPAVHRLGIATAAVRLATVAVDGRSRPHKVIPYAAVVYDTRGSAWAYVQTAPRTYRREPITITDIQGTIAVLASGPAVGTAVVTVGAPELLGTEYNISGEQ